MSIYIHIPMYKWDEVETYGSLPALVRNTSLTHYEVEKCFTRNKLKVLIDTDKEGNVIQVVVKKDGIIRSKRKN